MKRATALLVVAVVGVLAVTSLASGKTAAPTLTFKATIDVAQVVPHPKETKAGASGTFRATLTGTTLTWTLTYSQLTGHAVAALMSKGGAYVNVHTDKNAEGEIRSEITFAH